jgi:hypothetical protein
MTSLRPKRPGLGSNRGSALLATMCFATVLAIALTTYQALCYQTLNTSNRNAQSTHAIELAELGMEYATWSRTNARWTTAAGGLVDWATSGSTATTTLSGSNYNFSNGATGSIDLTVTNYNVTAYNYATSTYPTSVVTSAATITLADGSTVKRTLQATLKKTEPFSNALAAVKTYNGGTAYGGTVTMNSGGSRVDSYSSSTSPSAATTDYAAIVMGQTGVTMSTSALINGYVATPPNSSNAVNLTYSTTATASKLKGPSTAAGTNIDTSRQTTSPYQNVFDVTAPSTADYVISTPSGTMTWGTANTTTTYRISTSSPTISSANITIAANSDVILVVSGTLWIDTGCQITISSGASLKILVSGGFYIYGGGITNTDKLPKNLTVIGTGSTTSGYGGYMYTPTKFYGTLYIPRVDFTVYGYNSSSEFFGAIVASDIVIYPLGSSNLKVHYDKDLAAEVFKNVDTPYTVQAGTLTETSP